MKDAIHWSHLVSLWQCGHKFALRYIEGLRLPLGPQVHVGSAAHASAAADLTEKIATGELLATEAVLDAARDALERSWLDGVDLAGEPDALTPGQHKGMAIDRAIALARAHHTTLAPRIVPTHVERAWRVEAQGYPFELEGEIDVQAAVPGGYVIRDLKTTGRRPSPRAAAVSDQLTMYALAGRALEGDLPAEVWLDYMVLPQGSSSPSLEPRGSVRTDADVGVLWARLDNAAEVIERGAYTPANRSDWWCSVRWCEYARTDPETGRPYCRYFTEPVAIQVPGSPSLTGRAAATRKRTIDSDSPEWRALVGG